MYSFPLPLLLDSPTEFKSLHSGEFTFAAESTRVRRPRVMTRTSARMQTVLVGCRCV